MQHVQPPAGAKLIGFKHASASGMTTPEYWSIRQTGEGYAFAETGDEIFWPEIDGADILDNIDFDEEKGYGYDGFSTRGDPLAEDAPMHSLTTLSDDDMAELLGILVEHDVLSWDGYDESWEPPAGLEVTDTGGFFDLKLLFSDGTLMTAHGKDAHPESYNDAMVALQHFLEPRTDYSAYYPLKFPDVAATSLSVRFAPNLYSPGSTRYSIELTRGWKRWAIVLEDPKGALLPEGTDISEYGDTDEELPFAQFMGIIAAHGLEQLNTSKEYDSAGPREQLHMLIRFENGQIYTVDTNVFPEGYESFKADMVSAIAAYYDEVREGEGA